MNRSTISRKILLAGIFAFGITAGNAQSQITSVQKKIAALQSSSGLSNASICIAVTDNQTGEELIKSEPQLSLAPASILKVVTTATALEIFGPDFRFSTTLSYSGIIRNDTLFGDLQIIGGGDPTLGSKYFPENNQFQEEWIKAMQEEKIKVVSGNLIMDATIYESQMIPNTWIWEDIGNYYGAGASGITVYDNLYEIHLSSENVADRPTKVVKIIPEISNLEVQNEVLSSDENSDQAYVFGGPLDNRRIIRGTIPKNRNDFAIKASVPDPAALLSSEFRKNLSAMGIFISGETKQEKVKTENETYTELLVIQSPPLSEIISVTNHESVNLFAEHFLKHLAFQEYGLGTTKNGCKFVVQFWKDKGLDMNGFFMNDGSGLSRFDAVSAEQMVAILNYMKNKSNYSDVFYHSLATAGNGTLTVFQDESFPNQCLRAKSGSMTQVRCYAGYITTDSRRQLTFTIMLNNFSCSQTETIRKIEEILFELRKI
ncbi:MAG TPA: D-alanyl-D-alanine carboxypeptidase/D-alanyl-D-alanine-endopeptidase [Prolixibacteraceae bacterium]|nr:D-alanyl-D-alanine carboxypeptidase/D-alanyl-D-alanine-endopeptidase [Prolixibacteraceae bacterium]